MLDDEQKFVLDLLRDYIVDINSEFDYNKIIDILREHKIFLHFYNKLNKITNDKFKNKIKNLYNIYTIRNSIYKNFLKEMVLILNQNNINYIIYKGLVLNNIIYGEKN